MLERRLLSLHFANDFNTGRALVIITKNCSECEAQYVALGWYIVSAGPGGSTSWLVTLILRACLHNSKSGFGDDSCVLIRWASTKTRGWRHRNRKWRSIKAEPRWRRVAKYLHSCIRELRRWQYSCERSAIHWWMMVLQPCVHVNMDVGLVIKVGAGYRRHLPPWSWWHSLLYRHSSGHFIYYFHCLIGVSNVLQWRGSP